MRLLLLYILLFPFAVTAQERYDSLGDWLVDTTAFYTDTTGYGESEYNDDYLDDSTYNYDYSYTDTQHTMVLPENLESTATYQAEELNVNKIEKESWKDVVGSTNYDEEKEEEEEQEADTVNPPKFNIPWGGAGLQMFSYALIIIIVLVVLYFILKNFTFSKKIKKTQLRTEDFNAVEDIEELNVDDLLKQAIDEANFKLAIRLYFLRLLKSLHTKQIIEWKKDKTNSEYLAELFTKNLYYKEIRALTFAYEQSWYGEHTVTPEVFRILKQEFETIQQNLQGPTGQ